MRTLLFVCGLCLVSTRVVSGFALPTLEPFRQEPEVRRSSFGEYAGYSDARFDGWETSSTYVEMRDGVLLAVDITLPKKGGVVCAQPLPLVWTHSRYHRRMGGVPMADSMPSLQRLLRHGYAVASAAVRGSGASFGTFEGLFSPTETLDAVELIEWFAEQPFCDGNIGMYGGSYLGITQYMAASEAPEALKAIYPDMAAMDMYDTAFPGGVFRGDMVRHWAGLTAFLDREQAPVPVDGDADGDFLRDAVAEHEENWDVLKNYSGGVFRDHADGDLRWVDHGPIGRLQAIRDAEIPSYHSNGWYDVFVLDALLWFANYEGPQHLIIGDWSHAANSQERRRVTAIEQHRWFDRWLKGIDNGIEREAPIHYALMSAPGEMSWRSSDRWPLAGVESRRLHFAAGESRSSGSLTPSADRAPGFDDYAIDPTTTTGAQSRWDNAVGAAATMEYSDLAANDRKCLTYTTAALDGDLAVVGHPLVTLWLTAAKGDADLHVLLEEIDANGGVHYVTEGVLRASQRKLSEAPFDNLGLPYQRCFEEDAEPVPADEPVEVRMDLAPTATIFNAGHRLRVTIMGADADNTDPSPLADNSIRIFRGGAHDSSIDLPVLP